MAGRGQTDGSQNSHRTAIEVVNVVAGTVTAAAVNTRRTASVAATPGHCLRVAHLSAVPSCVRVARALLANWLQEHPCSDDAVLLAAETVTNAVRHGSPTDGSGVVRLVARWLPGQVYVAVTDDGVGTTVPRLVRGELDAVGGRGLLLVDELAQRWDTARVHSGRRRVWFELVAR